MRHHERSAALVVPELEDVLRLEVGVLHVQAADPEARPRAEGAALTPVLSVLLETPDHSRIDVRPAADAVPLLGRLVDVERLNQLERLPDDGVD